MNESRFQVYYPLSKVEEQPDGTLKVWARATQEIPDRQGEIFDYDSSVPVFKQRADENMLDTDGAVAMPMKTMHQPLTTPGKWMEFSYNDADKAIDICGKVVDPVDVKKVQEKVYRGVSVGGHYAKKWRDPANPRLTRFTGDPTEISLVDKPAVPTAKINMFKVADVIEETELQKDNPNHDPANGQFTGGGDGGDEAGWKQGHEEPRDKQQNRILIGDKVKAGDVTGKVIASHPNGNIKIQDNAGNVHIAYMGDVKNLSKSLDESPAWVTDFNKHVELLAEIRKADQEEKDKNESKMKSIGDSVGISRRKDSPLTAPKDYPDDPDEYGDPANFNFPVDEKRHVQAVGRFNGGQGSEQYSPSERHIVGRRIARLASRFGGKYQYDPKEGQINRKEEKSMSNYVALTKEQISKLDMPGMVGQLKAIKDQAADQVGKDPTSAVEFLMSNLEALCQNGGEASAVGSSTTLPADMAQTGDTVAVKADVSKVAPATSTTPATSLTPTPAETESEKKAAAAKPAPSTSTDTTATSTSTDTTPTPVKKADAPMTNEDIQKKIDEGIQAGLQKVVDSMKKSAPVVNSNDDSPVMGGLQAIANGGKKVYADMTETERKIVEIMDEGGPFAMKKAVKLVMDDDESYMGYQVAQETISSALRKSVVADFNRGGVIVAKNFVPKIYTPEPEKQGA